MSHISHEASTGRGFLGRRGRFWAVIASWFVPFIMTGAYIALTLLADTDAINDAWFAIGLLFVLCMWWMFRMLTQTAALARALAVGDADSVLELADHALAGRFVVGRPQLVLYRAAALELRGEWRDALAAVEAARVPAKAKPKLRVLAASVTIGALVETGELARARAVYDGELRPIEPKLNHRLDAQLVLASLLARGRLLTAEGDAGAGAVLQKVIDDVRASDATRQRARAAQNRQAAASPA